MPADRRTQARRQGLSLLRLPSPHGHRRRPSLSRRISRRTFLGVVLPGFLAGCATASGWDPVAVAMDTAAPDPTATPAPVEEIADTAVPPTSPVEAAEATPAPEPEPTPMPLSCAEPVPVIGIVAHQLIAQPHGANVDGQLASYRHAVALAGGAPVLIPLGLEEGQWRAIYSTLDGLLLAGGVDVDPVHYDEAPHPQLGTVDPALDRAELMLARWALADQLPLLGICRGAQVLNVAAGGSLVQDIPSQWAHALVHASPASNAHTVMIRSGNRLKSVLGVAECMTNSRHHQAAKELGPGFVVTAVASDGIIEALERIDASFCIGVQWHPENLVDHDPVMLRLFTGFVAAAAAHSKRCGTPPQDR